MLLFAYLICILVAHTFQHQAYASVDEGVFQHEEIWDSKASHSADGVSDNATLSDPENCKDDSLKEKNFPSVVYLPNVDQFGTGLDFSTGERRQRIFQFTFKGCISGKLSQTHYDFARRITYCIPDEVSATSWHSECSSFSQSSSTALNSSYDYKRKQSSKVSMDYDTKMDASIPIPLGSSETKMKTEVHNHLGYGKSRVMDQYIHTMRRGFRSAAFFEAEDKRWVVALKEYRGDGTKLDYRSIMTPNFKGHLIALERTCSSTKPDFRPRLNSYRSASSQCEEEAARLISKFGTHFNTEAQFGGRITQSTVFNSEAVTRDQMDKIVKESRHSIGILFFKAKASHSSSTTTITKMQAMSQLHMYTHVITGGSPRAKDFGEWCESVAMSPTIISNSRLRRVSSLTTEKYARAALEFAIMDQWYCNGGRYYITNRYSGSGACTCPPSSDYILGPDCIPKEPNCGTSSRPWKCHFAKIIILETTDRYDVYVDDRRHTDLDGNIWKPRPPPGYIPPATYACGWIFDPPRYGYKGVVFHRDTSTDVVRAARGYTRVLPPTRASDPASNDLAIYRPQCDYGFSSISDIGAQHRYGFDTPRVFGSDYRPCIADRCMESCSTEWNYDTGRHNKSWKYRTAWWALRSMTPGYQDGKYQWNCGWFRHTDRHEQPPSDSLIKCIKMSCITRVL